jgi:hypothetical protein
LLEAVVVAVQQAVWVVVVVVVRVDLLLLRISL